MQRWIRTGCAASLILMQGGCLDGQGDSAAPQTSRQWNNISLKDVSYDQAFDLSVAAARQYFPTLEAYRDSGGIESSWIEYEQRGGTGRIRDDAFKTNNRMRRKMMMVVAQSAGGATAMIEVRVQRLDTADQRAFQQHREFNDVPNSTPIEREAGVSGAQSESWTELSRDSRLEDDILQSIFNRVVRLNSTSAPAMN